MLLPQCGCWRGGGDEGAAVAASATMTFWGWGRVFEGGATVSREGESEGGRETRDARGAKGMTTGD